MKVISLVVMVLALSAMPAFAQIKGGTPSRSSSRSSVSTPSRSSSRATSSSKRSSDSSLSGSRRSSSISSSSSKLNSASSPSSSKLGSANTNRSSVGVSSRSEGVRNGGNIGATSHSPATHVTNISSSNSGSRTSSSLKRSSSDSKMQTAKANINHSREKLIQKRRSSQAGLSTHKGGSRSTTRPSYSQKQQSGFSNFVYSPQRNSVMKMYPSSANKKSSPRQIYRSGLWNTCARNWSGNHTTNKSDAQDFMKRNYDMNMIDYGFSEGVLYVISEDSKGVFLQACDEDGHVLDEQEISREYKSIVITEENSGCWIMKKREKDPLYYYFDGKNLLRYDIDEGKKVVCIDYCEAVTYAIISENHHTYFQVYGDIDAEHPLASSEIDDNYTIIDVDQSNSCACYIKDAENNLSTEVFWYGDEIMLGK